MNQNENRQHRRLPLRLTIAQVKGLKSAEALWTTNVSAGGMYLHLACDETPNPGLEVGFELLVPPGDGYSICPGRIHGKGTVLRATKIDSATTGIAVEFNHPPAMDL